MRIKTLNKKRMVEFKDSLKGAEDFPNADAWAAGIKSDLQKIKPNWSKEDVNTFVTHFVNNPIAKAFLRGAKFKSLPKIREGKVFP